MARFQPEEYKADGGFTLFGLPILLLILCAAGAALGWLASFIGQWFYLIVIFPLAIGIGLVIVGIFAGRLTKMRSPGIAVVMGLISSGVAISSMHYSDYQRFSGARTELMKLAPLLETIPPSERDAKTAEALQALKEVREVDTFARYMNMEATRGVTLSRRKAGINLGYIGSWIYWCVELLVVAGMATLGLVAGAAVPFCSTCNTWKEDQQFGTLQKRGVDVAAFLRSGEIDKLKEHSPAKAGGDLVLSAAVCPTCKGQSTIVLKLEEVTKNAKGEEEKKEQLQLTFPGDSLAEIEALFQNAPESSVPKRNSISFEGLGDLKT